MFALWENEFLLHQNAILLALVHLYVFQCMEWLAYNCVAYWLLQLNPLCISIELTRAVKLPLWLFLSPFILCPNSLASREMLKIPTRIDCKGIELIEIEPLVNWNNVRSWTFSPTIHLSRHLDWFGLDWMRGNLQHAMTLFTIYILLNTSNSWVMNNPYYAWLVSLWKLADSMEQTDYSNYGCHGNALLDDTFLSSSLEGLHYPVT